MAKAKHASTKRNRAMPRTEVSEAELVVLRVLWDHGPSTVHEVVARLGRRKRAWAYNTVLTFLRRLVAKGYVSSEARVAAFQFAARLSRDELIARRLHEVARELADGSLAKVADVLANTMAAEIDATPRMPAGPESARARKVSAMHRSAKIAAPHFRQKSGTAAARSAGGKAAKGRSRNRR